MAYNSHLVYTERDKALVVESKASYSPALNPLRHSKWTLWRVKVLEVIEAQNPFRPA